jgi:CsoR family transcriptional regulator, copper-sensing transcriptional repressor
MRTRLGRAIEAAGPAGATAADGCGCEDGGSYLTEAAQRAFQRQLARIEGHVAGIARMVGERACADDILLQVTAVKGALNRFASTLVEEELRACMACVGQACDAPERDDRVERLAQVIATMLKQS